MRAVGGAAARGAAFDFGAATVVGHEHSCEHDCAPVDGVAIATPFLADEIDHFLRCVGIPMVKVNENAKRVQRYRARRNRT